MGSPHIGAVDTRMHEPGTVQTQVSAGGGISGIFPVLAGGAVLNTDVYLRPRVSLSGSAGAAVGGGSTPTQVVPGARLGLRIRVGPRLSIGAGAMGNTALEFRDPSRLYFGYGGDFEIATSRIRSRDRFASHAWRVVLGTAPEKGTTYAVVGDWTRSAPIGNSNTRLSYGVNYGVTAFDRQEPKSAVDCRPDVADCGGFDPSLDGMPALFVGGHVGLLWGFGKNLAAAD